MTFQYMTAKNIKAGELAGIDSFLGMIIPARPNDIRIGFALRDIYAGEIVQVSFTEDTEDFRRQSSQEFTA